MIKSRYRHFLILNVLMLSIVLFNSSLNAQQVLHRVAWVSDGDTIMIDDGRRIRYIGINAPEIAHDDKPAEPFGYEAAELNRRMVLGKFVRLEPDQQSHDQYGRLLAYVFLADGTCINQKMIREGLAYCLPQPPNLKYEDRLLEIQRLAMSTRKGIWPQWKNRHERVIGNKRSRRFHSVNCSFGEKTEKRNLVIFSSPWEAFQSGFAPCKRCITLRAD